MEELRGSSLPRCNSPPATALCLAPLLILLPAGRDGMGDEGAPGFKGCKQTSNGSVLGARPGGGWDTCTTWSWGWCCGVDYSECLITEDGEYLIPDHVHVVPPRETVVETRAELIEEWLSYTDTWAASINAELSFLPTLNETPDFQPAFRQHLLTLSDHLENNQTREAEYLAEMLVLKYGTHILTNVEARATLVQEDQPEALPEFPAPAVRRVAATVRRAIHRYYAVNALPGCLRRAAPAFNPQATVEDGSCGGGRANFSFGGVFQECEAVSRQDAEHLCQAYRIPHSLTGYASCPANYTASALHSKLKTGSEPRPRCQQQCRKC
ncbi:hypothetical protein HPG69_019007 [Diceros bicornis minor]|uniref:Uncharacterized protein n=1 Tax=Diceros bicornis minor TaxID=77932 RepID=A0A7J7FHF9_DICBM|nr:hypothetical protein HPG69_019007 [Diceros bicornis minor]